MTATPSVTSKVMAILEAFLPGDTRLTLSEICRRAGLPPATGHRLVGQLADGGFLERLPEGTYRIGMRLWRIGAQAAAPRELREVALPYMEDLYTATRENVQLAVLGDDKALYVERLRGAQSVPIITRVAGELPLHATGVGKVLLAFADPELTERVIESGLEALTPQTNTDPERLRAELARIRRSGVAFTKDEMTLGSGSVAVPVREGEQVVAALSLVARRYGPGLRRLAPAVLTAARALSRDLSRSQVPISERRAGSPGGGVAPARVPMAPDPEHHA